MRWSLLSSVLVPSVLLLTIRCGGSAPDEPPAGVSATGTGASAGNGAGTSEGGSFAAGGNGSGNSGTGGSGNAGAGQTGGTDEPGPSVSLDDVALYINAGDSLAAGYNAAGNNGNGGKGYARLLLSNHPDYPAYAAANLTAVAGSVDFRDVSDSGATSDEILANLSSKLPNMPASVDGDVLLTISAGGNDFNDDVWVMISPQLTQQVAQNLRNNLAQMVSMVRDRYEDPAQDKDVIVVFQTIHDPTGGTGQIPPEFDEDFCGVIQNPMLLPFAGTVLSNLQLMNDAIAEEASVQGAYLSDNHALYLDHGMNAPGADRWLADDCVHPTSEGHHQLRRQMWGLLTDQWL